MEKTIPMVEVIKLAESFRKNQLKPYKGMFVIYPGKGVCEIKSEEEYQRLLKLEKLLGLEGHDG